MGSVFPDPGPISLITSTLLAQQIAENGLAHWWSLWSHAFFLFPIIVAGIYEQWHALSYIVIAVLVSLQYHACFAFNTCSGMMPDTAHGNDMITATLLIVAVLMVAAATRDDDAKHYMHMHFWWIATPVEILSVVIAMRLAPYSLWVAWMAWIVALEMLAMYAIFFRAPLRLNIDAGAYVVDPMAPSWPWMLCFLLTLPTALWFFIWPTGMSWSHSAWHVFAALAIGSFIMALMSPPTCAVTILEYKHLESAKQARALRRLLMTRIQQRAKEKNMRTTTRGRGKRRRDDDHELREII